MKVSEAKKKVCPFMSYKYADQTSGILITNCICGDCMAWEYTREYSEIETIQEGYEIPKGKEMVREWTDATNQKYRMYGITITEDEKEGYCKRIENV